MDTFPLDVKHAIVLLLILVLLQNVFAATTAKIHLSQEIISKLKDEEFITVDIDDCAGRFAAIVRHPVCRHGACDQASFGGVEIRHHWCSGDDGHGRP